MMLNILGFTLMGISFLSLLGCLVFSIKESMKK